MSKEKSNKDAAAVATASLAGRVTGLRASGKTVELDLQDKKKRSHTFSLDASSSALTALASAAYVSGKKLHVVAKPANGSAIPGVAELRFGNRVKPAKAKKVKAEKPVAPKSPAEAASAPGETKAPPAQPN